MDIYIYTIHTHIYTYLDAIIQYHDIRMGTLRLQAVSQHTHHLIVVCPSDVLHRHVSGVSLCMECLRVGGGVRLQGADSLV